MDDQRKTDNVVKIFIESLKETKDVSDQKIEAIAKGIVSVLASIYDPSKKEFRDKVNVLKMKLKGSRNSSARQALLQDKISANDFVNLPQDQFTQEYFDSLISGNSTGQKPANTQAPPRSNQMISNQVKGTQPQPRGISRPPPGGARMMPPAANSFRPIPSQVTQINTEDSTQNQEDQEKESKIISNQEQQIESKQIEQDSDIKKTNEASDLPPTSKPISQKNEPILQNIPPQESQQVKSQLPPVKQENKQEKPQQRKESKEIKEEVKEIQPKVNNSEINDAPPNQINNIPVGRSQPPITQAKGRQQLPSQRRNIPQNDDRQPALQQQQQVLQPPITQTESKVKSNPASVNPPEVETIKQSKANLVQPPTTNKSNTKQLGESPSKSETNQNPVPPTVPHKEQKQQQQQIPSRPVANQPIQQADNQKPVQQAKPIQQKQNQPSQPQQNQVQQNLPLKQAIVEKEQNQKLNQKDNTLNSRTYNDEDDEEGECEDAHVSQMKSQIDEFKKIKEQFREQLNADEQILNNLSNQDDYSYYDDEDYSYEDQDRKQNKKNNFQSEQQHHDVNHSDEYVVQQKKPSSPQKPQQIVEPKKVSASKVQQVDSKKHSDSKNPNTNQEYLLHQQIENQKQQEEIQKKQKQNIVPQTIAHTTFQPAIDSNIAASHSSKQTQSRQKLDEMSDFEKIELNPALRNQEFEDNNEDEQDDEKLVINVEQKVTNFDQKNGGFANPFQISVPKVNHQRISSNVVVKQEDQDSIDRLKNVNLAQQNPPLPQVNSNQKRLIQGPDGEDIEVTNILGDDCESDNIQNILQGLNDQEQSRKGSDEQSQGQQQQDQDQEDFIEDAQQNNLEKDKQEEQEGDDERQALDIENIDNYSEKSSMRKKSSGNSSNSSQLNNQNKYHKQSNDYVKSEQNQYQENQILSSDVKQTHQNQVYTSSSDCFSTLNNRLISENKQLTAKINQILQEQNKREETFKKKLIEKERKNLLLDQQNKETQDEISIIKQYLDQIIEENSKYKQQYDDMKQSFGQNESLLREELSQLKQKIKTEYTNEIQQLRSINAVLTQNNQYLQSAVDSLAQDLESKDSIIQKLVQHSSEQLNRSYQNINSKSLNYSVPNTQSSNAAAQQIQNLTANSQQKGSNNYMNAQLQQQSSASQQQQIQQQQNQHPTQQQTNYGQTNSANLPNQGLNNFNEEENEDCIGVNIQGELEVDLQQNQEYEDQENHLQKEDDGQQENQDQQEQQEEQEDQNENQNQDNQNIKVYDQEENNQYDAQNGEEYEQNEEQYQQKDQQYDQEHNQYEQQDNQYEQQQNQYDNQYEEQNHEPQTQYIQNNTSQNNQKNQITKETNNQYSNQINNSTKQKQSQEQVFDDAENFFDQLLPGTKTEQPPNISESQKNQGNSKSSQNATKTNTEKQVAKKGKKDSLQEQIYNIGGGYDDHQDVHNQSNSNFFDLNSIPNVQTTSEIRNTNINTKQNRQQKNAIDLNQAENTFISTENDFFNTITSDKFNTSNISAIPNPFNNNNFFHHNNFTNPFTSEPQSAKNLANSKGQKKGRNAPGNLFQ